MTVQFKQQEKFEEKTKTKLIEQQKLKDPKQADNKKKKKKKKIAMNKHNKNNSALTKMTAKIHQNSIYKFRVRE